jgi:hypothetical protein
MAGFQCLLSLPESRMWKKFQSLVKASGKALVLNCVVIQYLIQYDLRETDFMMLKCLVCDTKTDIV